MRHPGDVPVPSGASRASKPWERTPVPRRLPALLPPHPRRKPARALAALAALAAAAAGCSAGSYSRSADREAAAILEGRGGPLREARERDRVFPSPPDPASEGAVPAGTEREPPVEVPATMTLQDALRIGIAANRDYRDEVEGLTLSALALSGVRYEFSPRLEATLSYLVGNSTGAERADTARAAASVSQVLPTGGTITVSGQEDGSKEEVPGRAFASDSTVAALLRQPLLKGAGYESSHEALTQAERDVVYALRDFERFREQFLLDVTSRYFAILAQRIRVRNFEERFESVQFQTAQAEALFQIGRQDKLEVLRVQNDLLSVENDLLDARDALSLAIDQFKVFLGLPTTARFEFAEATPEFLRVDVSLSSAVEAALSNRYDLANARDRLEDAERGLRIARRNLLPDLALEASWRATSGERTGWLHDPTRGQASSLGLVLDLPLQQTLERNAYRTSEIALEKQRRDYERFRDDVVVEVRETLRRLRQAAVSLEIQTRIIALEEKRSEKAQLDFEAGTIGNRDLIEAQQSLLDAKNERVNRVVEYELARISLERSMGTLEVEPDGTWRALIGRAHV